MKRQAPYADANVNTYVASQMQHVSGQTMQQNTGMTNFPGHLDPLPAEEEHSCRSSKAEGKWQWDRDANKVSKQMSSHPFNEGQGGNGTISFYQGQMLDPKLDPEKQANKEARVQFHEEDMEIGYEDNHSPLTYEGLERKFLDEIMTLAKDQSNVEDAENARHREKIIEINTQFQEKLLSLRARQANKREEFLRKESQARLHEYQQAGMSQFSNNAVMGNAHAYSGAAVAASAGEAHRAYASSQLESYREKPQYLWGGRTQATEGRVPYPAGRVYNTGGHHY